MAAHAIKAGEGDCFVAGGVETVSRYMNGAADTGHTMNYLLMPNKEARKNIR